MCENNIFSYATKELSQDAIIAYIVKCLDSSNELDRRIARQFINTFICELRDNSSVELLKLELQSSRIDVYVELKIDRVKYSVIVENKTKTFLHDDQLKKYCEKVLTLDI